MKNIICAFLCLLFCGMCTAQNVGIGTLIPTTKLHVSDTLANTLQLTNSKTMTTGVNNRILFQVGGFYTGVIGTYATGLNSARMGFSTFASVNSNSPLERLSITDNGNVGISNSSPAYRLDINGSVHASGNAYIDGSVGIGTLNPAAKLDVSGSIKVNGNITKTTTGAANMLPYAYGKIAANGTILGSTGNFTATRYSQGVYRITLTNDANLYANRNLYTVLVSAETILISGISSVIDGNNFIEVFTFDEEPTNGRADMSFNILIYRL